MKYLALGIGGGAAALLAAWAVYRYRVNGTVIEWPPRPTEDFSIMVPHDVDEDIDTIVAMYELISNGTVGVGYG